MAPGYYRQHHQQRLSARLVALIITIHKMSSNIIILLYLILVHSRFKMLNSHPSHWDKVMWSTHNKMPSVLAVPTLRAINVTWTYQHSRGGDRCSNWSNVQFFSYDGGAIKCHFVAAFYIFILVFFCLFLILHIIYSFLPYFIIMITIIIITETQPPPSSSFTLS